MTYRVNLKPSDTTLEVAADQFILDAALAQGVGLAYGCRDGACGSCRCKLLSGTVDMAAHSEKALSAADQSEGWILACKARPLEDLELEVRTLVPGAVPPQKFPARVAKLEKLGPDLMRLILQLPSTDGLQYKAGQYVDILLQGGARRSYSIANAYPLRKTLLENGLPAIELHIRHMPGGLFTDHAFENLKEKDILRIEGPHGSFMLQEDKGHRIFLASGTGFAPIKAMVQQLELDGHDGPVDLYWGCNTSKDFYDQAWLASASQRLPWLKVHLVVSAEDPGWTGRRGFVHQAVMQDHPDMRQHHVYACGAPVMVCCAKDDFVMKCCLPDSTFCADSFTSAADRQ